VNCEVTTQLHWVGPDQWLSTLTVDHAEGFDFLDLLTAVDRPDQQAVEVLAHVVNIHTGEGRWRGVAVTSEGGCLPTMVDVFIAASWHEREIAEMFGVEFVGGCDAPLLHLSAHPAHPLRKDTVLAARAVRPWPGAQEPGSRRASARRRTLPAGVVDGWLRDGTQEGINGG
jgi:NADH-quinone oxidoreductase subunit C